MREDDGILAEVMVAESDSDNTDARDPVVEHFVELRKYIEHSHGGLSKRLERVEAGQQRLERKVDAGFDRLGRKIDALASTRRAPSRRRKP
jgi:hypothetical protein